MKHSNLLESFSETNALAYSSVAPVTNKKSSITLIPRRLPAEDQGERDGGVEVCRPRGQAQGPHRLVQRKFGIRHR
jgi:hypothetical protein